MPTLKRYKTDYKGVYYIMGPSAKGKPERIYYIRYRNKDGKQIDEKAGRQSKDDMSVTKGGHLKGQEDRRRAVKRTEA